MPRRTPRVDDAPNREILDDIASGLRRAAILQAAIELDIFTRIAEGQDTLPAITRACASTERGMRLLLDALVAIGLLSKELTEYRLSPTVETFLVKGERTYIGEELLEKFARDTHGHLSKTIRTGKIFAARRTQFAAEDVSALWKKIGIAPRKTKQLRVLDALRAGDLLNRKLKPRSFDLVLFGNSINFVSPEQVIGMFRKAYEALAQNGRVVIHAPMADDERGESAKAAMTGIDALLFSPDGDVYTFIEYRGMLEAAGFVDVVNLDDDLGLVVARRVDSSQKK